MITISQNKIYRYQDGLDDLICNILLHEQQFIPSVLKFRHVSTEIYSYLKQQHAEKLALREGFFFSDFLQGLNGKSRTELFRIPSNPDYFVYLEHEQKWIEMSVVFSLQHHKESDFDFYLQFVNKDTSKSKIYILLSNDGMLDVKPFDVPKPTVDIVLNYGQNFVSHHEKIIESLKRDSGLYIFNSVPGAGKTYYLRYLNSLIDREFIYIPSSLFHNIDTPHLMDTLINRRGAVLILEDAEKVIMKREGDNNSLVSALLNMSDGFLRDVFNFAIIVTYNTDTRNVDDAVLRKGRVKYKYTFGPLSVTDAQKKVDSLGNIDYKVTQPMTLAEIYNLHSEIGELETKSVIGFKPV